MRQLRSMGLALGLAVAAGVIVGRFAPLAWAAETWQVAQKGRNFAISRLDIARGDAVDFTNEDEFLHQIYVKSADLNFDSDEQAPGQTIEVRFRNPGTYQIRCHIHPKMLLVVAAR